MGLLKLTLLQILLHRKRISTFFLGFHSLSFSKNNHDSSNINGDSNREKEVDGHNVCRGEVETVLRRLGVFWEEETLPSRLNIFDVFEERSPSLDEVREAFEVFDRNRDGFIDDRELQKVLCDLGLKEGLEMESCRRMIGVVDEDGDGRIDFVEFVKFMENSFI